MFCIERVVMQLLQNKLNMLNMILQGTTIYQNIIQEDDNKITELIKVLIYETNVYICACVCVLIFIILCMCVFMCMYVYEILGSSTFVCFFVGRI